MIKEKLDRIGVLMSSQYESKVLSDNIWRINDIKHGVSMYLIEGLEKALLIDAGDLKSGLKQYVETLTISQ